MGGPLNSVPSLLYRGAIRTLRAALPLLGAISASIRDAARERAASLARYAAFQPRRRPNVPLVLFHAASAGELRQVEPVLRRLRQRQPGWQFVATCFSPSGLPVLETLPLDLSGLLPWDVPGEVSVLLEAAAPDAIVFCKHDVWPTLATRAAARGAALGLIAATVRPGSRRLGWPARQLLRPAYAALTRVGAIAEVDAERLIRLGVAADLVTVLGDPRADTVLDLVAGREAAADSTLLVAGSTWPADEAVLLAAFARVRLQRPDARLLLAPHRPGPAASQAIARQAERLGLPAPVPDPDAAAPLLVLDRVGPLAMRYGDGCLAYVGGGFGTDGLHSVLEPAGWGLPVITGPRRGESRDALRLERAGALVPLEGGDPVAVLAAQWHGWMEQGEQRRSAGRAARQVVREEAGAADRSADLVEALIRRPSAAGTTSRR